MQKLNIEAVKDFYEEIDSVWPADDIWHKITKIEIEKYIKKLNIPFCEEIKILNAGSGGNCYGLSNNLYHVDIAENKIKQFSNHTVANIERLPFASGFFNYSICVGSVINYADALSAISELSRVTAQDGILILEFESSWSLDFKGTNSYKKSAQIIKTQYNNKDHYIWVYSIDYIKKLLIVNNFVPIETKRFHMGSNLAYSITKDLYKSAKFQRFDFVLNMLPYFRKRSHNIIIKCIKK